MEETPEKKTAFLLGFTHPAQIWFWHFLILTKLRAGGKGGRLIWVMPKRQGVFFWDPFLNVRPKLKRWPLSGLWIFNKLWINPKLQVPGSVLPESTLDQIFPSVKLCQDAFDPLRRDSWPRKRDKSREKGEDTWVRAAQCEKCRNVGTTQSEEVHPCPPPSLDTLYKTRANCSRKVR